MNPFGYTRAGSVEDAVTAARQPGAMYLGGGTNLIDLTKYDVLHPDLMVDVTRLPNDEVTEIGEGPLKGGVRIGAAMRNSDTANHALIRRRYPLLSQALLSGASAQLRNMATMGGNLLQRTRCYYFMDTAFERCNKRSPGSGCAAREGYNRLHAIFGASEACIATNPSDMNVALAALDAVIVVQGARGERRIPIAEFHRLPGDTPHIETELAEGELITAVELPLQGYAGHSHYLKIRDRASYAFALVSAAVGLQMDAGTVQQARIALGGVAHKPWRLPQVEAMLAGQRLTPELLAAAGDAAASDARPYAHNAFKVELTRRAVVRSLEIAGGLA